MAQYGIFPTVYAVPANEKSPLARALVQDNLLSIVMTTLTPLFKLGKLYQTPGVVEAIPTEEVMQALARHQSGDWGDVSAADKEANEFSLGRHLRLLSAYQAQTGEKFWVITEADRSATTVLLPSEY